MRAIVDQERCQGHGMCHMTAPELFDLGEEEGQAYVLVDEVGPELADAARDGADACPERAIAVIE